MRKASIIIAIFSIASQWLFGQTLSEKFQRLGLNTITTAVPFMLIAPDSRAGGMGDVGVATSPDGNSIHWNPAKLAFVEEDLGLAVSYTPWLRQLVPDINLSYLSGFKKIDKFQTIGASLRYFSLGDIQFTDQNGNNTIKFNPNEFAFDIAYSRLLSKYFSGGISLRYISSNLTGGQFVAGTETSVGRAVAADISMYYQNTNIQILKKDAEVAFGVAVSNIGNKMNYSPQSTEKDFLPINLRLGPRTTLNLDDYNRLTIAFDVNKLLVPSPPLYAPDTDSILAGRDPNRPVASGVFGSFSDAPGIPVQDENGDYLYNPDGTVQIEKGSVFIEELQEITWGLGTEYWYGEQFALRAGYFWEHPRKGNRRFITLGAGLKYNVFALDFSYLVPAYFNATQATQKSPLQNTLRFTLKFNFEGLKSENENNNG